MKPVLAEFKIPSIRRMPGFGIVVVYSSLRAQSKMQNHFLLWRVNILYLRIFISDCPAKIKQADNLSHLPVSIHRIVTYWTVTLPGYIAV